MTKEERRRWDERYSTGSYQPRPAASPFLESWITRLPVGRSLDLACGAGRNALRLAEAGQRVDAVDISSAGVEMARAEAARRGLDVTWVVADLDTFQLETAAYDLITVIRYANPELWPRVAESLAPNGWLLVEHHMQTERDVLGPTDSRFRLQPQELLDAFSSLRIIFYEEAIEPADHPADCGQGMYAVVRLVACNGDPGF
ncbi:MAG: class I SAM-dependent methyltransferase [Acidimicrobiales bacterium]|nr:class I SAM-dependent methyltransferase [Acidimicrobiales bacterium]